MHGPDIIARSLTVVRTPDSYGNQWQYHSRSDKHSKISCWAILFDFLAECSLLQKHVEDGKVAFGINHEMHDFKLNRKKDLDLVICKPASGKAKGKFKSATLRSIRHVYNVILTEQEEALLDDLPDMPCSPVGSVRIALEAKACMTAHIKALPRLFDELTSSEQAIHGDTSGAMAVGFVIINASRDFASTEQQANKKALEGRPPYFTSHDQPKDLSRVITKIRELPRRTREGEMGFDAVGVTLLDFRNDFGPVKLVPPEKQEKLVDDILRYESMVERMTRYYATTFKQM